MCKKCTDLYVRRFAWRDDRPGYKIIDEIDKLWKVQRKKHQHKAKDSKRKKGVSLPL